MNHTYLKYCFLFLCLATKSASAQPDVKLYGDLFTTFYYNPASFGTWNKTSVNLAGQQFQPAEPFGSRTLLLTADYKFGGTKMNAGTGIQFYYTEPTLMKVYGFSVPLNIQLKFDKARLSIGASPGIRQVIVTYEELTPPLPNVSETEFVLDAGIMLFGEKFYAGFSGLNINQPAFAPFNFEYRTTWSVHSGYRVMFNRKLGLFPSFNAMWTQSQEVQIFSMLPFYYQPARLYFGPGVSLQSTQENQFTLHAMAGWSFKDFDVRYNFGYRLNNQTILPGISHEIRLSFRRGAVFGCSTCPHW